MKSISVFINKVMTFQSFKYNMNDDSNIVSSLQHLENVYIKKK